MEVGAQNIGRIGLMGDTKTAAARRQKDKSDAGASVLQRAQISTGALVLEYYRNHRI